MTNDIYKNLIDRLFIHLCVLRDYYNPKQANKDLNDFYLNASFLNTINDFEKYLADSVSFLIKNNDDLHARFDKLKNIFDLSYDVSGGLNNLILASKKRINVISHLLLNKSFSLDKITISGKKKSFKFSKPSINTMSYSNPRQYSKTGKITAERNCISMPDHYFSRVNFFFEEAYQRRNALVHRTGNADDDYLNLTDLKKKAKYSEINLSDNCKSYLINNKFYEIFNNKNARVYSKEEAYKEDLSDISLSVVPTYYSHVIMQLHSMFYYLIDLALYKDNKEQLENYFEKILFHCICFNHHVSHAETKYIFFGCNDLIDFFFKNYHQQKINNQMITPYSMYIKEFCDRFNNSTSSKKSYYNSFLDEYGPILKENMYGKFYNSLVRNQDIEMAEIFKKMCMDKVIKSKDDIITNFIFAPAIAKSCFRDLCQEYLSCSVKKDDFVNKFSVQYG